MKTSDNFPYPLPLFDDAESSTDWLAIGGAAVLIAALLAPFGIWIWG